MRGDDLCGDNPGLCCSEVCRCKAVIEAGRRSNLCRLFLKLMLCVASYLWVYGTETVLQGKVVDQTANGLSFSRCVMRVAIHGRVCRFIEVAHQYGCRM